MSKTSGFKLNRLDYVLLCNNRGEDHEIFSGFHLIYLEKCSSKDGANNIFLRSTCKMKMLGPCSKIIENFVSEPKAPNYAHSSLNTELAHVLIPEPGQDRESMERPKLKYKLGSCWKNGII
jgi:hypothetical protein